MRCYSSVCNVGILPFSDVRSNYRHFVHEMEDKACQDSVSNIENLQTTCALALDRRWRCIFIGTHIGFTRVERKIPHMQVCTCEVAFVITHNQTLKLTHVDNVSHMELFVLCVPKHEV